MGVGSRSTRQRTAETGAVLTPTSENAPDTYSYLNRAWSAVQIFSSVLINYFNLKLITHFRFIPIAMSQFRTVLRGRSSRHLWTLVWVSSHWSGNTVEVLLQRACNVLVRHCWPVFQSGRSFISELEWLSSTYHSLCLQFVSSPVLDVSP